MGVEAVDALSLTDMARTDLFACLILVSRSNRINYAKGPGRIGCTQLACNMSHAENYRPDGRTIGGRKTS